MGVPSEVSALEPRKGDERGQRPVERSVGDCVTRRERSIDIPTLDTSHEAVEGGMSDALSVIFPGQGGEGVSR